MVLFLGLTGLRWSEMVALRPGDVIEVPGLGVRVQRAMTSAGGGGRLVLDTVKNNRARTVPLVDELRSVLDRAVAVNGRAGYLFCSPTGEPLRLSNCGHLMDRSLWDTAARLGVTLGGILGAVEAIGSVRDETDTASQAVDLR